MTRRIFGNDDRTLSDEELEARTRARLVTLGVEVTAPLLLPMPGSTAAPAPPTGGGAGQARQLAPSPRSARKKSANDLLGLVA